MTAHNILDRAAQHMRDRAATYDKPEGERSMGATVLAFQAVTGHQLTEEQGWLFMALLKAVRSQQGAYRADSYEDGAAYFALAGEAACNERNGGWSPEAIDAAAFKSEPEWPTDDRIDVIGQNGNDGKIYEYRDLEKPETWKRGDIVKLYEDVATTYVELDSVSTDLGLLYWVLYWVDQNDVMKACKIPAHIRNVQSVEARS